MSRALKIPKKSKSSLKYSNSDGLWGLEVTCVVSWAIFENVKVVSFASVGLSFRNYVKTKNRLRFQFFFIEFYLSKSDFVYDYVIFLNRDFLYNFNIIKTKCRLSVD